MIQVRKSATAPRILQTTGRRLTQRLCDAYDASPSDYRSGRKTFTFKSQTYAAKSVKKRLLRDQHDKCCFCESKGTHVAYGDVEHFRPKAGYRQEPTEPLARPGYYWLAYDWTNLFFCCQLCNQHFKRNLFPLGDTTKRAVSHNDSVADEEPLFVTPLEPGIEGLMAYREEYAYAINGSQRASTTIEYLGLNREKLVEVRRDRLQKLKIMLHAYNVLNGQFPNTPRPQEVEDALREMVQELEDAKDDSAEYAAMARALIGSLDT